MVIRYPDLEVLLELPTPDYSASVHEPVDADMIRRHVVNAFRYGGEDERGTAYNGRMLHDLIEVGDGYAEHEDWPNAAAVYQLVAEGVLEHYHTHVDHEGDLGGFVNDCAAGLGNCLAETAADPPRESILHTLFEIYHWDVEAGGLGVGDQVPGIILEQATPRERQTVAQWIQQALASSRAGSHEFHRQAYGGFLLPLQGDYLDDESYLRLCRETARWQELVRKLLTLCRENEALSVAAQVDDFYLPRLADIFVAQGYAEQIKMLVRQRAQASPNPHHQFHWWLKKRAQEEGDRAEELSLQEILFWQHPTLEGYQELHTVAEPLGCWDDLRSGVLARLDAAQNHALLTVIHLTENEIDLALETVEQVRVPHWQWTAMPLRVQVAQASEKDHPRDAIRLYLQAAEDLISARGRENYVEAAGLLARVRALCEALGEPGNWQATILDLRERHRALRALKEELNRAGL